MSIALSFVHLILRECITALKDEGREIWATDLSIEALSLEGSTIEIPKKIAVVMGKKLSV